MGSVQTDAVSTKSTKAERFCIFDLSDILTLKGNYIPLPLLDQFSIQILLSSDGQIVPVKQDQVMTNADHRGPAYVELVDPQIHMYYYTMDQEEVRAM